MTVVVKEHMARPTVMFIAELLHCNNTYLDHPFAVYSHMPGFPRPFSRIESSCPILTCQLAIAAIVRVKTSKIDNKRQTGRAAGNLQW